MRNLQYISILLLSIYLLTSCELSKNLYLFNDHEVGTQPLDTLVGFNTHRIQPNDRVSIIVSSMDPTLTAYLNASSNQNGSSNYLVNQMGYIEFPMIGNVKVNGLTTTEVSTLIKEKLSYFYKDLFISVNLSGRVYIISGVAGSTVPIANERLTILEALSQSPGSLTPQIKKNDIWLIREDSGRRSFYKMDLTSKQIFQDPHFYLKNNDVLYMKANKFSLLFTGPNSIRMIITTVISFLGILYTLRKI